MYPLKKVRLKNKVSLEKLASVVGSDVGNLSRIERGLQMPSKVLAEKLAKYFEGQVNEFEIIWPQKFTKNAKK